MRNMNVTLPIIAVLFTATSLVAKNNLVQIESNIQKTLNKYCADCHDDETQKGDIRLDNLVKLSDDQQASLLSHIEEQVFTDTMPPKKKTQLSQTDRKTLFDSIKKWYDLNNQNSQFRSKLQLPEYGNYVDHGKLFSGEYKTLKGFTYDRDWLISEFIFANKMNGLLQLSESNKYDGKKQVPNGQKLDPEVVNPFKLPDMTGVRYYANHKFDSSHFMSMIGSAKFVAKLMVDKLSKDNPSYLPAVHEITKLQFQHNATIEIRRQFMDAYIDEICTNLYGRQNDALLPKYTKITLKEGINPKGSRYNKHGWVHNVGKIQRPYVRAGIDRFVRKGVDKMKILRDVERYYFHLGLERQFIENLIQTYTKQLSNFIVTFANSAKRPVVKIKPADRKAIEESIRKVRKKGMTYMALMDACEAHWQAEFKAIREKSNKLNDSFIRKLLTQIREKMFDRKPTEEELNKDAKRLRSYAADLGVNGAIRKMLETYFINPEFAIRNEYGTGQADQFGRKMLSPKDASYAIAYALTDSGPDAQLTKAAEQGKLNTKADYKREVERLLKDRSQLSIIDTEVNAFNDVSHLTYTPIRKLRFFREFFGYHRTLKIFKDRLRFNGEIQYSRPRLIVEADMLVDHILEKDKNVFEELLGTEKFYVYHDGSSGEKIKEQTDRMARAYKYFIKHNWMSFQSFEDVKKHKDFLINQGLPGYDVKKMDWKTKGVIPPAKKTKGFRPDGRYVMFLNVMAALETKFEGGKYKNVAPHLGVKFTGGVGLEARKQGGRYLRYAKGEGVTNYFGINIYKWNYPSTQPAKLENRKGMLTHPAWLQAFSQNLHTDPVIRGKWIREKLLGGTIPDVPIGVDAQIPQFEPKNPKTLRQRLAVKTGGKDCWKCHKLMNPLGNAFEMYDDFGRYRTAERIEHPDFVAKTVPFRKRIEIHPHQTRLGRGGQTPPPEVFYKTLPINTTGQLEGTGDKKLDGDVKNAIDLIDRLVKSERVRQSIIRHAFRYFMGRNEMLPDSKTLIDADQAYVKSGGSFDAVIVSLLTSDSFIYRKDIKE